jgi:rare lipoprotein A (peptidoglycan hydrolase)
MPCVLRAFVLAILSGSLLAPASAAAYNSVGTTATYYHPSLHGSVMANGRPYNRWDPLIAASNWYPLGTTLKVTRQTTNDYIFVRVQDRGSRALTIDLSEAGFSRLGGLREGRIAVWAEVMDSILDAAPPASVPAPAPAEELAPDAAEPDAAPSAEPAAEPAAQPSAEPGPQPAAEPSAEPADSPFAPEEIEDVPPLPSTTLAYTPRLPWGVRPMIGEEGGRVFTARL